jgi:hypothetical protein
VGVPEPEAREAVGSEGGEPQTVGPLAASPRQRQGHLYERPGGPLYDRLPTEEGLARGCAERFDFAAAFEVWGRKCCLLGSGFDHSPAGEQKDFSFGVESCVA